MDKEVVEKYLQEIHHRMNPEVHTIREEAAGFAVYYMEHYEGIDSSDFDSCYTFISKEKLEQFLNEA